ncbi:MAG: hypothetical protein DLM64_08180 [Solirubrobacterales bacterium]|nr:MAG: hypothetical protein DLM64_08180 [Solirubrobacterales bacterium]
MGNENLRAALQHAGLQPDDLAQIIEVDVKTVRRWLSGMAPYPRHRGKVARALDATEDQLWPELATPPPPSRHANAASDLLAAYPTTNDPTAPDWHALMREATERIDLLDETLIHVLDIEGVPDLLASKATQGCNVRILIAEATSPWVRSDEGTRRRTDLELDDDEQEDHHQREADAKAEAWQEANERACEVLRPLIVHPRIEIHGFSSSRFNTILRFDDQMLVTLHLWAEDTLEAPLMHLQRNSPDGLFDRFAEHYDTLWTDASLPIEAHPDADQEEQPREPSGRDEPPPEPDPGGAQQHAPQQPSAAPTPDPARPRRWPRRPPSDLTG